MIEKAYIDQLQALTDGGAISDENRLNYRFMAALLAMGREVAIASYSIKKRVLPKQLVQTTFLVFNKEQQESDCYAVYSIPPTIQRTSLSGGLEFIGNDAGTYQYIQVHSLEQYTSNLDDQVVKKIYEKEPPVIHFPDMALIRLMVEPYKAPKRLMVRGVFVDPNSIPEFNSEQDDYPITNEIFAMAKDYLISTDLKQIVSTIKEAISNSAPDSTLPKPVRQ
jgi:hypothetical protein